MNLRNVWGATLYKFLNGCIGELPGIRLIFDFVYYDLGNNVTKLIFIVQLKGLKF